MSYSNGAKDPVKVYSSWFWGWKTEAQWLLSASITPKLLGLELKTFQQYPDSCQLDFFFFLMNVSTAASANTKLLYVPCPYSAHGPFRFSLPSKTMRDLYPWSGAAGQVALKKRTILKKKKIKGWMNFPKEQRAWMRKDDTVFFNASNSCMVSLCCGHLNSAGITANSLLVISFSMCW